MNLKIYDESDRFFRNLDRFKTAPERPGIVGDSWEGPGIVGKDFKYGRQAALVLARGSAPAFPRSRIVQTYPGAFDGPGILLNDS